MLLFRSSTESVEKLWIALRGPASSYSDKRGSRLLHSAAAFTEGPRFHRVALIAKPQAFRPEYRLLARCASCDWFNAVPAGSVPRPRDVLMLKVMGVREQARCSRNKDSTYSIELICARDDDCDLAGNLSSVWSYAGSKTNQLIVGPQFTTSKVLRETYGERFLDRS
jgi:hypothetical protein